MAPTLEHIVELLNSDKVKERQDGLKTLDETFADSRKVDKVEDIDWQIIFTALFSAFNKEKQAATKKGTLRAPPTSGPGAVATERLKDTSKAVRTLVARSVKALGRKPAVSVLQHLYANLKYHGALLEPVAHDYLRTIEEILKWQPHLDHLRPETWIRLLELCFNVLLEDSFRTRLEDELEDETRETSMAPEGSGREDPAESEVEDAPTSPNKKRRRGESRAPSHLLGRLAQEEGFKSVNVEKITVANILSILLQSPSCPVQSEDYPFLPAAILNRFQRLFQSYSKGTLHPPLLSALSAVLSRCVLNNSQVVIRFSRNIWSPLAKLWNRGRDIREHLVVIIRMLLPFLASCDERFAESDLVSSLMKLWTPWSKELGDSKKLDLLSLESIRLQVRDRSTTGAFVANTFSYGWEFDAKQALAWAMLELRADCAAKLYRLSESIHTVDPSASKRPKLEDPVSALLGSIQRETDVDTRTYRLQCLLFLIDRHWSLFHAKLQESILSMLMQLHSYDDAIIQSWTLLCLSAVAHACVSSGGPEPHHLFSSSSNSGPWDAVWTHALRRTNAPRVCRAACHVAHVLLLHGKVLLSPNKILSEIETLAKDLDSQGPSFPFDSVCSLLVMCMRVASQDVRLYRMQLEDKVLTWLIDTWRPTKHWSKRTMPSHTVSDILSLFGAVCGAGERPEVISEMILPDCIIVEAMLEEYSTRSIRDFVLYAQLPPFHSVVSTDTTQPTSETPFPPSSPPDTISHSDYDLPLPGAKERRLSAFLLKYLEEFTQESETNRTVNKLAVERVRTALDFVVTAFYFESLLALNGHRPDRRVVKAACKSLYMHLEVATESRWTWNERLFILGSVDAMLLSEPTRGAFEPWEMILPPGPDTGIRQDILHRLATSIDSTAQRKSHTLRMLQKTLFRNTDVQEALPSLLQVMRDILSMVGTSVTSHRIESINRARDGFELRVNNETINSFNQHAKASAVLSRIVDTCVGSLATFPYLQSSSPSGTRDQDLHQFVIDSEDEAFFLLAGVYLDYIHRQILHLNVSGLMELLEKVAKIAELYSYSSWEGLRLLVVSTLRSTIRIWTSSSHDTLLTNVQELCRWLCRILGQRSMVSWRFADAMASFLDDYLRAEPSGESWHKGSTEDMQPSHEVLHELSGDVDTRVRLRAVVASARSFRTAQALEIDPKTWYHSIRHHLGTNIDEVEHMLTRLVCLGNIILVNSSVRRGAYWHFLELCLHTGAFNSHMEAISRAVSERMNVSISRLFELYASQVAFSIRQTGKHDFLRLPFRLLGYESVEQCAQAAMRSFSSTNLLTNGEDEEVERHGRRLFKNHCQVLNMSLSQVLRENLAEIVGQQIAYWIHSMYQTKRDASQSQGTQPGEFRLDDVELDDPRLEPLEKRLASLLVELGPEVPFTQHLRQYADGIIAALLRTLGDQDYSHGGPVVRALDQVSGASTDTFLALTKFRTDVCHEHEASLLAFDSASVLKSLEWFHSLVPHTEDVAITYHVLHHLFAALERSPLVNEQLKLLNVLSMWIACRHQHFANQTVMKTFLNGALNLLSQIDLACGAQSMLAWAFSQLYVDRTNSVTCLDSWLTEVLLRIGRVAHDFRAQDLPDSSQMGATILDWIEAEIISLYQIRVWRTQVVKALVAWPRDLGEDLQRLCQNATPEHISQFLQDSRISTNKFPAVHRLKDAATNEAYEDQQFATSDFWRLRSCIPLDNGLSMDDVSSFAELLLLCKGHVDGLDNENIIIQSARTRHIHHYVNNPNIARESAAAAPRPAILSTLLHMLEGTSTAQVYHAFTTLRALASTANSDSTDSGAWPSEYAEELTLLRAYSNQVTPVVLTDIRAAFSSDEARRSVGEFSDWVTFLAATICQALSAIEPFYIPLIPMLRGDALFAEELLPVLVHTILQLVSPSHLETVSYTYKDILSGYFSQLLSSDYTPVSCRRVIVDTVLHLRHFRPTDTDDPLAHDLWLDVDFTLLSQSAVACGAYTTGLLFTELAAEHTKNDTRSSPAVEQVLFEIYTHIDEPDGFYGIETNDLYAYMLKRLHHEDQWQKAFQFHGAALNTSRPGSVDVEGMLQSLHAFGFNHLAMSMLQNIPDMDNDLSLGSMTYNLGWRTDTWDLPAQTHDGKGLSVYLALRAVHRERDDQVIDSVLRRCIFEEASKLRSLGEENTTEIREVAQNLLCLNEIRKWQLPDLQDKFRRKDISTSTIQSLSQMDPRIEYPVFEALTATRISLLHSMRYKEEREQVGSIRLPFALALVDIETKCLIQLSEASRKARKTQIAINSARRAQQLSPQPRFDVEQELAQGLWSSREPRTAKQTLERLLVTAHLPTGMKEVPDDIEKAALYALLGSWTAEARLEKVDAIKLRYFDTAVSLLSTGGGAPDTQSAPTHARVFRQYASFAEQQYNSLVKSPKAMQRKLLADSQREELRRREENLKRMERTNPDRSEVEQQVKKAKQAVELDANQVKEQNQTRDVFLEQAITMHSRALSISDDFDDCAIRLCSLWLSNFESPDVNLQIAIGQAVQRVPSRKFVFLAHQLTARLAKEEDLKDNQPQQTNLRDVIIRMCREHPYHSLFPVYCLRSDQPDGKRRQSSRHDISPSQLARSAAAMDISQRLEQDPSCRERVAAVNRVCNVSLEWAKYRLPKSMNTKTPHRVPAEMRILKLSNVKVPVLTAHTPIDPESRYEDCIWIEKFEDTFELAGGVNIPKISRCLGSDGKRYKQLYKGQGGDDLRQDAVMEQVFDLVNVVLRHDRETARRNLRMRGYKVIPLSSQAGVIEFVSNTMPLGHWLYLSKSSGHVRYRPMDILPHEFSSRLSSARRPGPPLTIQEQAKMTELFVELRRKFKPVMRHFFTEQHKHPKSWFRMRLNYSRSAAVGSIVGHVIGLGDRHLSNILIDTQSGELVHIDLGIAFEQGMLLKVPELVPFRLTADMVDGLGTTGVNGVFRKCSEETLRVLQSGADVILTVLEVFKYDPLHSWVASDVKLKRMQPGLNEANSELAMEAFRFAVGFDVSTNTAGLAAGRALNSVAQKLDKNLNVEETVDGLIAQATDVHNLGNMYSGWSPHL